MKHYFGNIYYKKSSYEGYILAQSYIDEAVLINISDGNRWIDPVKVNVMSGYSGRFIEDNDCDVWEKITGGYPNDFTRVINNRG